MPWPQGEWYWSRLFAWHAVCFSFLFSLLNPNDLLRPQTMTDVVGNPEEERRAEFYFQPWAQEAVCRYFYSKVHTCFTCMQKVFHAGLCISFKACLCRGLYRCSKDARNWNKPWGSEIHKGTLAHGKLPIGCMELSASLGHNFQHLFWGFRMLLSSISELWGLCHQMTDKWNKDTLIFILVPDENLRKPPDVF